MFNHLKIIESLPESMHAQAQVWSDWAIEHGYSIPNATEVITPNPFFTLEWNENNIVFVDKYGKESPLQDEQKDALIRILNSDPKVFILAQGDSGEDWDGECACICLLPNGQWIGWKSWWGPTGDGFCCDAYGGNEILYVSDNPIALRDWCLGEVGERLVGWRK